MLAPNWKIFSAILLAALVLIAIKRFFVTEYTEEVELADGSVITVKDYRIGWKGFRMRTTQNA